jgi:hypothetical protein
MPRPFPFPFNIGTDVCHIPRVLNILKAHGGIRFVRRILTEKERDESNTRFGDGNGGIDGIFKRWGEAKRVGDLLQWKWKGLEQAERTELRSRLQALAHDKRHGRTVSEGGMDVKKSKTEPSAVLDTEATSTKGWMSWTGDTVDNPETREDISTREKLEIELDDLPRKMRHQRGFNRLTISREEILQGVKDGPSFEESLENRFNELELELRLGGERQGSLNTGGEIEAIPASTSERLNNLDAIVEALGENSTDLNRAENDLKAVAIFLAGR